MKIKKVLLCAVCSFVFFTNFGIYKVNALGEYEINDLTDSINPPIFNEGIQTFGANPPSTSGVLPFMISSSSYNYTVSNIGYRVYTNKVFSGSSTMKVTVKNWKVLVSYAGATNRLIVAVYDKNHNRVASQQLSPFEFTPTQTFTANFKYLNPSGIYYVLFEVSTNSNRYSFNGTISK